jgi:spore maturation protein CgeB
MRVQNKMNSQVQIEFIKAYLKKYRVPRYLNAWINCFSTKQRYGHLCQYYGTPSVRTDPEAIIDLGRRLWKAHNATIPQCSWRPRVLWVGTDYEQDRSGILQALDKVSELTIFYNSQNTYGQLLPHTVLEIENCRHLNGEQLITYIKEADKKSPFDIIIGQMWGFRMHRAALEEARNRGIYLVNISMDDRHAFTGRRLADGTLGGTLGLAPYLSLACTDAPECVSWYEKEGCRAIFFPEASDPEIFKPSKEAKIHDVSFVGAKYGVREKIVKALQHAGIKVAAYGNGWPNGRISTDLVPQLFSKSKIVLGFGTIRTCNDFYALKLRDFDVPMCGAFYLTHANPDLHILYDVGKDILTFNTLSELVDKVRSVLQGDIFFDGMQVHNKMVVYHTWKRRFNCLLSHISTIKV